jgi:hypothetical protein
LFGYLWGLAQKFAHFLTAFGSFDMTRPHKLTKHCQKIIRLRYQNHGSEALSNSSDADDSPADATIVLKHGANAEGYWRNADLVKQLLEKAFSIFKIPHPNCDGLFMFDNSQNHHAKPLNALSVNVLNLKDGGKNSRPMRKNGILTATGSVSSKPFIHLQVGLKV